jgi:hypothetical protein
MGGGGGGVCISLNRVTARGAFCFSQWQKEYIGNILSNHTENNSKKVFNLEMGSEFGKLLLMFYMHSLSCPCHCLHHAVKNPPLLILSLDLCSFLIYASLLCM